MDDEKEEKKAPILDRETLHIIIPECCREGWDSCEHVPKLQKKSKTNVAL